EHARPSANTPNAANVRAVLTDLGSSAAAPSTRDALINRIVTFGTVMDFRLGNAAHIAARYIEEPPPAQEPSIIAELAKLASGFVFRGLEGVVSKTLSSAYSLLDKAAHVSETVADHVGDTLADSLGDATKHTAIEAGKTGAKQLGTRLSKTSESDADL